MLTACTLIQNRKDREQWLVRNFPLIRGCSPLSGAVISDRVASLLSQKKSSARVARPGAAADAEHAMVFLHCVFDQ
jgi:hypothetical protein